MQSDCGAVSDPAAEALAVASAREDGISGFVGAAAASAKSQKLEIETGSAARAGKGTKEKESSGDQVEQRLEELGIHFRRSTHVLKPGSEDAETAAKIVRVRKALEKVAKDHKQLDMTATDSISRALRARNGDVAAAVGLLQETIKWRAGLGVEGLCAEHFATEAVSGKLRIARKLDRHGRREWSEKYRGLERET